MSLDPAAPKAWHQSLTLFGASGAALGGVAGIAGLLAQIATPDTIALGRDAAAKAHAAAEQLAAGGGFTLASVTAAWPSIAVAIGAGLSLASSVVVTIGRLRATRAIGRGPGQ